MLSRCSSLWYSTCGSPKPLCSRARASACALIWRRRPCAVLAAPEARPQNPVSRPSPAPEHPRRAPAPAAVVCVLQQSQWASVPVGEAPLQSRWLARWFLSRQHQAPHHSPLLAPSAPFSLPPLRSSTLPSRSSTACSSAHTPAARDDAIPHPRPPPGHRPRGAAGLRQRRLVAPRRGPQGGQGQVFPQVPQVPPSSSPALLSQRLRRRCPRGHPQLVSGWRGRGSGRSQRAHCVGAPPQAPAGLGHQLCGRSWVPWGQRDRPKKARAAAAAATAAANGSLTGLSISSPPPFPPPLSLPLGAASGRPTGTPPARRAPAFAGT